MPDAWPVLVDLEAGSTNEVRLVDGVHAIELLDSEPRWQPDWWCEGNPARRTLASAIIRLRIDGREAELPYRPFQTPVRFGEVQALANRTRFDNAGIDRCPDLRAARIEVQTADRPWTPARLRFPVRGLRLRGNGYANTWGALVPWNQLYHHRGEDLGAIPGLCEVQAVRGGTVVQSCISSGQSSNAITIRDADGMAWRYAHMDREWIDPAMIVGAVVADGQAIGRTGSTWDGRKSQHFDPHLHLDLSGGRPCNTWPHLLAAHFTEHADRAVAIAGPLATALPGETVVLDGGRSAARPGAAVVGWRWELPDGSVVETPQARWTAPAPGLYSALLRVVDDHGGAWFDALAIRVFAPERGRDIAAGWCYHHPQRGIVPGRAITVWNRLWGVEGLLLDAGDGPRPCAAEDSVVLDAPGWHILVFTGRGPGSEPVTVRMPVLVGLA
jgi:hypothetical protein